MKIDLKKNSLPLICLLSSIVGLALIYIAALNIQPVQMKIGDIDFQLTGRAVTTSGKITYVRTHTAGHLFLTIEDEESKIQVPLFSSFMSSLNEVGLTEDDFKKGDVILVSGLVGEYQGELQVVPRKPTDIKILK